jgi:hypothetical protein
MRQGPRVEHIRCGPLPSGLGKIPRLAGIAHCHRQPRGGQGGDHRPLIASSGFQDNKGGLDGLEPRHKGGNGRLSVGHGPAFARGAQGYVALGFGDINTNKKLWGKHHNTPH